ncbi:hypothetical protein D3C81_2082100 [compost metagenome]
MGPPLLESLGAALNCDRVEWLLIPYSSQSWLGEPEPPVAYEGVPVEPAYNPTVDYNLVHEVHKRNLVQQDHTVAAEILEAGG